VVLVSFYRKRGLAGRIPAPAIGELLQDTDKASDIPRLQAMHTCAKPLIRQGIAQHQKKTAA
jgi:hypothetical protein